MTAVDHILLPQLLLREHIHVDLLLMMHSMTEC